MFDHIVVGGGIGNSIAENSKFATSGGGFQNVIGQDSDYTTMGQGGFKTIGDNATSATIAGGNSGGTAVDDNGNLIGVPTQAAAGSGITPVDARPVVDTNHDGRIDQRDSPVAVGGFINGLRPVNLAKALLQQAGANLSAAPSANFPVPTPNTSGVASFNALFFSAQVTADSRPVNPAALLPSGLQQLFSTFDYDNVAQGARWSQTWALNGKVIYQNEASWNDGPSGRKTLVLGNKNGLPDGMYHLVLTLNGAIVVQGDVTLGKHQFDTDSEVSGQVVDQSSGRGIANVLVIALKPGISVQQFAAARSKDMAYSNTRTGADGRFAFPQQLPKGQSYGLVVVAEGYQDLAIDGALRVGPDAPEHAEISAIPLAKE